MSSPINWFKQDPYYYGPKDPFYKKHIESIKRNLKLDKLISMASADNSYSITVKDE